MKKIIFGGASAALALIGFSAFKTANKSATTYYWFSVNENQSEKITAGQLGLISSSQVTFQLKATTVPTTNNVCDKTNTYYCLIGFTASQISGSAPSFTLKNVTTVPITTPTGPSHTQYVRSLK